MVSLDLPLPPSTNRLYRRAGSRIIKSAEYRAWIHEAGLFLVRQHPKPIKGRVSIGVTVGQTRKDLDNNAKGLLDLLVLHGVIEDDGPSIVRRINLSLDESIEGVRVTVSPFVADAREAVWG